MTRQFWFWLILFFVLLIVNSYFYSLKNQKISVPPVSTQLPTLSPTSTPTQTIANPASVNCADKGGQLQIKTKPDGSQYGLCFFDDGRACEEWAMFYSDCPVGGRKTTGYDTEAQKFCAWSGGQTYAVENAVCTFTDGSTCLADDFYTGTCQKGVNKK